MKYLLLIAVFVGLIVGLESVNWFSCFGQNQVTKKEKLKTNAQVPTDPPRRPKTDR